MRGSSTAVAAPDAWGQPQAAQESATPLSLTESVPSPLITGIFGSGRSGSTWLGAIIDSHPSVAYRFEALHRLAAIDPSVRALRRRLSDDTFDDDVLEQLYGALLPARPDVDKPPFFTKHYATRAQFGQAAIWPLARRYPALAKSFTWLYTPRGRPMLVFKEVTSERIMRNLLARTAMRAIYLIRHPAAVVHSILQGQGRGLMPTGRREALSSLVQELDPHLPERMGIELNRLLPIEIEALFWRIDAELGMVAALSSSRAHIVVYESLCDQPERVVQDVFAHLNLDFPESTHRFLTASDRGSLFERVRRGEFGTNPYFSVFRKPSEVRDRWQHELDADDVRRIMRMVEDSYAFQRAYPSLGAGFRR